MRVSFSSKGCVTAPRTKHFVNTLILTLFLSVCTLAVVPKDKKPLKVYNDSQNYAVFRGAHLVGKSDQQNLPKLSDFQGMKKIDRNYYVYARDYVFVLGIDTALSSSNQLQHKQELEWKSQDKEVTLCTNKGQTLSKCQNFIKIFQEDTVQQDRIIICATNAFDPACRIYQLISNGELKYTPKKIAGRYSCPFDPSKSVASLVTGDDLYTATEVGFNSRDALVHRLLIGDPLGDKLRTSRDVTMLNDPNFIRFVDAGQSLNKIYIFFTELAVEDDSYQIYTRAGQVCKNDQGGSNVLRKQFSSFFRVRLNCSLPGQPPFYFNEMRDVTDLLTLNKWYQTGNTKMVFAIMNTPRNSIPASAICAFTLDDIEKAMSGPFWEKYSPEGGRSSYWGKLDVYPKPHLSSCNRDSQKLSDHDLNFIRDHPLMYDTVPAWNLMANSTNNHDSAPLFSRTMSGTFLTALAVDMEAGSLSMYTVLIAGTEDGKIVKILLLQSGETVVIEERVIFNEEHCGDSSQEVLKINIDKPSGTMLVAFQNCLVRAPLCPINTTCGRECIESRDPYCGWDGARCVTVGKEKSMSDPQRGSTQPRQDVIEGNVDGMPDCEKPVVVIPVGGKGDVVVKSTYAPSNKSDESNSSAPLVISNVDKLPREAGSTDLLVILGVVALLISIIILIIGLVLICHSGKCARKKLDDNENLTMKYNNTSKENEYVTDPRLDSNQSNVRVKSRHTSNGSHHVSRHSNPRMSSMMEESRRNRTITESSQGNRSDDGAVFISSGDFPTPDTPNAKDFPDSARKKQLQSTSSSVGGRRKPRSTKHSTSSGPENNEDMKGSPMKKVPPGQFIDTPMYDDAFVDDEDLARQGSNDSGNGSEGFVSTQETEPITTHAPTHYKMQRGTPSRTMSLQGHHSHYPLQRTYSVEPHGTSTMGYTRPNGRLHRQHSLQVPDTISKHMQPRYVPQHTPSLNMPPGWPEQPQPVVTAAPNPTLNFDSRMATRSLDRRRPKGQNYQLAFSESYDESKHQQAMGKPNANAARKRYMSESSENPRISMARPPQCQPIHEEQEPLLSHQEERRPDAKLQRNKLHLNLNPDIMNAPNTQGCHSAPIMDPALMQARRFQGRMVTHSNPGTPQREMAPGFSDQAYPLAHPKPHMALPSQKQHYISDGMRHNLDAHPLEIRVSPTKSNPSSPMHDGRPPSFPNSERQRHYSGHANGMHQPPLSPMRTTAPMFFGTPTYNNNPSNGTKVRHTSGGSGRNQNGAIYSATSPEGQSLKISPNTPPVQQLTTTFS